MASYMILLLQEQQNASVARSRSASGEIPEKKMTRIDH